jgi:Family of unknown function (DUF6298)
MRARWWLACVVVLAPLAPAAPIDFSDVGYRGGMTLPRVPAKAEVAPTGADDTAAIQGAIDKVGTLPLGKDGFRGAVVLRPGTFLVGGQLRLTSSGVVLRGKGATIVATGISRRALIELRGRGERALGAPLRVLDDDVPAGARRLHVEWNGSLVVGARVVVRRPSTDEWLRAIGMREFPEERFHESRMDWLPGSRDLEWDRTIVAVDAKAQTVTLDAPITMALESRFGGGALSTYEWSGRLHDVGVEDLILVGVRGPAHSLDEEHAWFAVALDDVEHAWVRGVIARAFVSSAVILGRDAKSVTVADTHSREPVGEDGGYRRVAFSNDGQLVLVQGCSADQARHAFAVGHVAAGPNVFLDCTATDAQADAGPFESWAAGVLYDNVRVERAGLTLGNLGKAWQGAGWNAANSVVWNSHAASLNVTSPPTAENMLVEDHATPSLYRAQRAARRVPPSVAEFSRVYVESEPPPTTTTPAASAGPLSIVNGRFTVDGRALFGGATSNAWWKGHTAPARARELGHSITRWVPGRVGRGLTEDLDELSDRIAAAHTPVVQVWPGLWYDRRQDDHTTGERPDADVWAPFYEMPWARSGQRRAWDGLSRYDLTRFNPWYFDRLRAFASLCARKGLVLMHHFYNNHNLIEAAAHWAIFPWRPANALQATGLLEPPPYDHNGSHIAVANIFYDVSNPVRRDLHRLYIRHGLDVLKDEPNVVHAAAFQDAAPLAFQQFFLDVVSEWQRETGRRVHIALVTGKNVTDAILADPERAALVDVIDMRYWQYLADGTLFAPAAGEDKAYREYRTEAFGKDAVPATKPEQLYRQVREYTERFPDKAVIAHHAGVGPIPVLMAGGAAVLLGDSAVAQPTAPPERDDAAILRFVRENVADALVQMRPVECATDAWCLADASGGASLVYSPSGAQIQWRDALRGTAPRSATWFDPQTGAIQPAKVSADPTLDKPTAGAWLLLLR